MEETLHNVPDDEVQVSIVHISLPGEKLQHHNDHLKPIE